MPNFPRPTSLNRSPAHIFQRTGPATRESAHYDAARPVLRAAQRLRRRYARRSRGTAHPQRERHCHHAPRASKTQLIECITTLETSVKKSQVRTKPALSLVLSEKRSHNPLARLPSVPLHPSTAAPPLPYLLRALSAYAVMHPHAGASHRWACQLLLDALSDEKTCSASDIAASTGAMARRSSAPLASSLVIHSWSRLSSAPSGAGTAELATGLSLVPPSSAIRVWPSWCPWVVQQSGHARHKQSDSVQKRSVSRPCSAHNDVRCWSDCEEGQGR